MELILYKNFSKRINSTKRPTGGDTFNVVLKEGCSIENPTFLIDGIDLEYNYCKWNGHYYYISDITLQNRNIYEINCTQDVLATHKSEIGSTKAYVEYSASDYNKWIPDNRISMSNETKITSASQSLFTTQSGCYVIAVAGEDTTETAQIGLVNYYAINVANLKVLSDTLYSDDIVEDLKKFFNDPFKSFISAHWCPFSVAQGYDAIYLGYTNSGAQGNGLRDYVYTDQHIVNYTMDIPWNYDDFRNFAPYTKMTIWLPFYGSVELDPSQFINNGTLVDTLYIKVSMDPISGEVIYALSAGLKFRATYKVDTSIPLEVGQTTGRKITAISEIGGGALALGAGIASVATGGASVGAITGIIGGVTAVGTGIATAFASDSSSKGGTGGFGSSNLLMHTYYGDIYLSAITHKLSAEPSTVTTSIGRPLYETKTINTLSGYVKCAGASVNMDGFAGDKEEINKYLNSGFYYE